MSRQRTQPVQRPRGGDPPEPWAQLKPGPGAATSVWKGSLMGEGLPIRVRTLEDTRSVQGSMTWMGSSPPASAGLWPMGLGLRGRSCHWLTFLRCWVVLGPASCHPSIFVSGTPAPCPSLPAHPAAHLSCKCLGPSPRSTPRTPLM